MQQKNLYTIYLYLVNANSLPLPHDRSQKSLIHDPLLLIVSCPNSLNKQYCFESIFCFVRSIHQSPDAPSSLLSAHPSLEVQTPDPPSTMTELNDLRDIYSAQVGVRLLYSLTMGL